MVSREDEREVAHHHYVSMTPQRPIRPLQSSFSGSVPDSAWSDDGSRLYVTSTTRAYEDVVLAEIDPTTGESRTLVRESAKTYVELSPGNRLTPASWYVFDNGDDLWWSQRDVTDLYGLIYFPPDLDPERKCPIITHIYPGPQVGSVGRSWDFRGGGDDSALAQL